MSNRDDWSALVQGLMEAYQVTTTLKMRVHPAGSPVAMTFVERLKAELHNAFVAGQESQGVFRSLLLEATDRWGVDRCCIAPPPGDDEGIECDCDDCELFGRILTAVKPRPRIKGDGTIDMQGQSAREVYEVLREHFKPKEGVVTEALRINASVVVKLLRGELDKLNDAYAKPPCPPEDIKPRLLDYSTKVVSGLTADQVWKVATSKATLTGNTVDGIKYEEYQQVMKVGDLIEVLSKFRRDYEVLVPTNSLLDQERGIDYLPALVVTVVTVGKPPVEKVLICPAVPKEDG